MSDFERLENRSERSDDVAELGKLSLVLYKQVAAIVDFQGEDHETHQDMIAPVSKIIFPLPHALRGIEGDRSIDQVRVIGFSRIDDLVLEKRVGVTGYCVFFDAFHERSPYTSEADLQFMQNNGLDEPRDAELMGYQLWIFSEGLPLILHESWSTYEIDGEIRSDASIENVLLPLSVAPRLQLNMAEMGSFITVLGDISSTLGIGASPEQE